MAATIEQIQSCAELGTNIISLQLALALKSTEDALQDTWALGYCFGVFDALGRRAKLDQYTDGFATISIGFARLAGTDQGSVHLSKALDVQTDRLFSEGNMEGGSEVYQSLDSKDYKPLGLMNHFAFGRPEPRRG